MKNSTLKTVSEYIEEGIKNAYSYQQYRNLVSDLLAEGKSTGNEQSEALTNYSTLNDRRMKRWDKTLKINESVADAFSNTDVEVTWVVLTEGWCGDAAHILPVMNKLASLNEGIDLKIVLRDEHDELMNNFLTNGGKSIPKLIAYDAQNKQVLNSWGPRPSTATEMVNNYKEKHGGLDAEFKEDLQTWYNKDKGANIAEDLLNLL
ncbi:thioredoxin family protein [Aquimarina aquimarini]|uniref:thioredoxin family protein n=1 Tax=Aquimarina aquimarini TaxID=1191734 RepID=UPI000D54BA95|nr:thioredoxin family protein [Aquimarina aquimarini]